MSSMKILAGFAAALLAAVTIWAPRCSAQSAGLTTIYEFPGTSGSQPLAGLTLGDSSTLTLYGTTNLGGTSDMGTVFSLQPSGTAGNWTEQVIESPTSTFDPYPHNGLVMAGGILYGVGSGGTAGVVFRLTPPASPGGPWTPGVLYSFQGGSDGATPVGNLVVVGNTIYGVTSQGGLSCGNGGTCGTVYELTPAPAGSAPGTPWIETVLYRFTGGMDGGDPQAGLVMSPDGTLYGTTSALNSGPASNGTVFQLAPPVGPGGDWTETVLYTFTGKNGDGAYPAGPLSLGTSGSLTGVTSEGGGQNRYCNGGTGCGTVFQLMPPAQAGGVWQEAILHAFQGLPADGAMPNGALVVTEGAIYGSATAGANTACYAGLRQPNGCGAVFQLTAPAVGNGPWTETLLYRFQASSDGARPYGGLVMGPNGALYGTTSQNGKQEHGQGACCGTVFAINWK